MKISFDNVYTFPEDDGFRNEIKYVLNPVECYKMIDAFTGFLETDNNSDANGEYIVKTRYFDTLNYSDYNEKMAGIYARQKYRIRTYNDSGNYKLEKKIKKGNRNKKISGKLTEKEVNQIIYGNTNLKTGDAATDAIIDELRLKGCRNSVYIEYTRRAFTLKELDIRITLDRDIKMLFGCYGIGETMPDLIPAFYADETILEVKYKEQLPKWLQRLIYRIAPSELSVSKYAETLKYILE